MTSTAKKKPRQEGHGLTREAHGARGLAEAREIQGPARRWPRWRGPASKYQLDKPESVLIEYSSWSTRPAVAPPPATGRERRCGDEIATEQIVAVEVEKLPTTNQQGTGRSEE